MGAEMMIDFPKSGYKSESGAIADRVVGKLDSEVFETVEPRSIQYKNHVWARDFNSYGGQSI